MTLYTIVLFLHSWLRWIVVLLALIAGAAAFRGWLIGGEVRPLHRRLNLAYVASLHAQLLLGLLLYFVLSPVTRTAFADFGAAMKDATLRFWAVEHLSLMLLAVVVATVASALSKRADGDRARHRRAALGFLLSLLLLLAGIPWGLREGIEARLFRF